METYQHIANLIVKQLKGELHGAEMQELDAWINSSAANKDLYEELTTTESLNEAVSDFYLSKENIWDKVKAALPAESRVIKLNLWKRWAVAASITLIVGVTSYFLFFNKNTKKDNLPIAKQRDVQAPKSTKAMIMLADGRIIPIDSLTSLMQGNVMIIKTADGKIIYNGSSTEVLYNTLSNPRGSNVIDMSLADGSHVWLNAGSSVTYPIAFTGNERKIKITGEGYFEIAHDASKPFYVSKGDVSVKVLGTHFNVNAYDDEEDIKVTLLEGSVKILQLATNNSQLLKPGQQAVLTDNGQMTTRNSVDLDEVMAWKNGFFHFNHASLQEVLLQVARWYDVEVMYQGEIPQREFQGEIERGLNLAQLLKILEKNKVHFTIEGRKIIVQP